MLCYHSTIAPALSDVSRRIHSNVHSRAFCRFVRSVAEGVTCYPPAIVPTPMRLCLAALNLLHTYCRLRNGRKVLSLSLSPRMDHNLSLCHSLWGVHSDVDVNEIVSMRRLDRDEGPKGATSRDPNTDRRSSLPAAEPQARMKFGSKCRLMTKPGRCTTARSEPSEIQRQRRDRSFEACIDVFVFILSLFISHLTEFLPLWTANRSDNATSITTVYFTMKLPRQNSCTECRIHIFFHWHYHIRTPLIFIEIIAIQEFRWSVHQDFNIGR